MVEHQRRRQIETGRRAQPVAQQHTAERGESLCREGQFGIERPRGDVERAGGLVEYQVQHGVGRGRQPLTQRPGRGHTFGGEPLRQLLGERGPDDLAGGRTGDGVGRVDLVRHLEPGQPLPAVGEGPRRVEPVRSRDDEGDRHLAQHVVPSADDSGVGDVGTGQQYPLDLGRIDVLPAPDDEFLDPAGDVEMAVRAEPAQVPGAVPTVGERLRGGVRTVVIARHQPGAADPDLPVGAIGDLGTGGRIGQPHREPRQWRPARGVVTGSVEPLDRDLPAGLRGAVAVEQGSGQDTADLRLQLRGTGCAPGDAQAQ